MNIWKIIILQIFCLCPFLFSGQNNVQDQKKIDAVIAKVYTFEVNYKPADLRHIATKLIDDSKKIDYDKGLAYGNYFLGRVFISLLDNKKSIYYTNLSLKFLKGLDDKSLESSNYTLLGACYQQLQFYSLAVENYKKSLNAVKAAKIDAVAKQQMESNNYFNISDTYSLQGKSDSVYVYLNKNKSLFTVLKSPNNFAEESSVYMKIGQYFAEKNTLDSAAIYIDKSLNLLQGKNHVYESQALKYKADFYNKQRNFPEAIKYGLLAMEVAEKFHDISSELEAAQALQTYYNNVNDYKNLAFYSNRNQKMNAELKKQSDAERNEVFEEILEEKKKENELTEQNLRRNKLLIGGAAVCTILLFSIIIYLLRKNSLKNQKKSNLILVDKDKIIIQKEKESELLLSKVNECFAEVIELAKSNSPEFFSRFQEVYPDFIEKVHLENSNLRVSELTLCAYFFLGFNAKDISIYTFKSVDTVRKRNYNLRKKFNLPPDESLELFLKKIMVTNI